MNAITERIFKACASKTQLYSIFDRVEVEKHSFNPHKRSELPVSVLRGNTLIKSNDDNDIKGIEVEWAKMEAMLKPAAIEATIPFLVQKYGWRISDNTKQEKYQDSAFCDQFRVEQALGTGTNFILVKGDLTGIQEYIYHDIQPKKAGGLGNLAKRLRARSIMVSLLADFVANVLLRELGLSSWHLLFAGAGHFNLLLPADKDVDLPPLVQGISASLRRQFGEQLELIIATEFCTREDLETRARDCFSKINEKIEVAKKQQSVGSLSRFFEEKTTTQEEKKKRMEHEIVIGGAMPKQHYIVEIYSDQPLEWKTGNGDVVLAQMALERGGAHTLMAVTNLQPNDKNSAHQFLTKNKDAGIRLVMIYALKDTGFLSNTDLAADFDFPIGFGFRFLGKNAPLKENGDIKDFAELAGKDKNNPKSDGFVRLGSLMLDVDDLGFIFGHGMHDANLARIVTLSRELNYFFTIHFDLRAREHEVYVVYSGGDDAFAVGKWDNLMKFAKVLQDDFMQFICFDTNKNADVHFSAGIVMSNPHYPIGRFYQDTKDAQKKSKLVHGKNRITVFDYTMNWVSYADKYDLGNQFKVVLKEGETKSGRKFSSSFAYRIMQLVKGSYYERDELVNGEFHRTGKLRMDVFSRNMMRMHYLFARNGFAEEDSKKITDELEKRLMHSFLKNATNTDEVKAYEARDYLVALNFAMLQARSPKK